MLSEYEWFISTRILNGCFGKTTKNDYWLRNVCPSVRPSSYMERLGSHLTDVHEIRYLSIFFFRKSVQKIQISLQSDKNDGYFTWRPMYIYDNISLSSSCDKKCFRRTLYGKSKHAFHVQYIITDNRAFYEMLWRNIYNFMARHPRCVFLYQLNHVIKYGLTQLL